MLQVPTAAGARVDVHAGRLRSPLLRIAGLRQYQFGIRILIVPAPGCDSAAIRAATEGAIRTALAPLDAATARVEVEIVDHIDRAGSGAKEKLVANVRA
jgi:hypothetical protein